MARADPATKLHQNLSARLGDADVNTILSTFSGLDAGLENLGPLIGFSQVRKGTLSQGAFLERDGHRGPNEMELFARGTVDTPKLVRETDGGVHPIYDRKLGISMVVGCGNATMLFEMGDRVRMDSGRALLRYCGNR